MECPPDSTAPADVLRMAYLSHADATGRMVASRAPHDGRHPPANSPPHGNDWRTLTSRRAGHLAGDTLPARRIALFKPSFCRYLRGPDDCRQAGPLSQLARGPAARGR